MQSAKTTETASGCSGHDHDHEEEEKSGCTCGGECGRRLMLENLKNQKPQAVSPAGASELQASEPTL